MPLENIQRSLRDLPLQSISSILDEEREQLSHRKRLKRDHQNADITSKQLNTIENSGDFVEAIKLLSSIAEMHEDKQHEIFIEIAEIIAVNIVVSIEVSNLFHLSLTPA